MLSRSAEFDETMIAGPSSTAVTATLIRRGVPIQTVPLLPGAAVTLDEMQAYRRTFTGTLGDDGTLAPHLASDPLAPYGVELAVSTSILRLDGVSESVPAGVFRLNTVATSSVGLITVTGQDRGVVVAAALNEAPYAIPPNTPLDIAIGAYLALKYPLLPFTADPGAHQQSLGPTPTVFQEGSSGDPWSDCRKLATQFGRELFVDANGTATLRVIPNPTNTPLSWVYTPGQMNMATVGTDTFDTTPGKLYNIAIVSSSGAGVVPVAATESITDPTSPLFPDPLGFGRRPTFYSSTQLRTTEQCSTAAAGLLNLNQGVDRNVSFSAVPHPAHEPGDVVAYSSKALGVTASVCLSSWTLQLDLLKEANYKTRRTVT